MKFEKISTYLNASTYPTERDSYLYFLESIAKMQHKTTKTPKRSQ